MSRSQYWLITDFDRITLESWQTWVEDRKDVSFLTGQLEQCPETQRRHAQMFVMWTGRPRISQCKEHLAVEGKERCHLEMMRGTVASSIRYCTKEDSRVSEADGGWRMEYGEPPINSQGKRNDLEMIRDLVREGKTTLEVIDVVPVALRYMREITSYRQLMDEVQLRPIEQIHLRDWQEELLLTLQGDVKPRRIFWIWSPFSGVGKSTTLRYFMANRLVSVLVGDKNISNMMSAYDKHKVIWFDFSRSNPLDALATDVLEQVSNTGYLFSGKYVSCQKWVFSHVVVTCNREPPHDRLPARIVEMRLDEDGLMVAPLPIVPRAAFAPGIRY